MNDGRDLTTHVVEGTANAVPLPTSMNKLVASTASPAPRENRFIIQFLQAISFRTAAEACAEPAIRRNPPNSNGPPVLYIALDITSDLEAVGQKVANCGVFEYQTCAFAGKFLNLDLCDFT
jgi:hypothetical protein